MRFESYRITKEIKKNLAAMGFKRPTDIQFKCIPNIQKGEDVLAIAQTGTGKTAAFAIPIIDQIQFNRKKDGHSGIKTIVLAPTRELAVQIAEVFHQISRYTKVKTLAIHGGVEQDSQINTLLAGVDILVSTPGRLFDLIHQGYVETDTIKTLIVDEADQMLKLGFYKDIQDLLRHLPKNRQTLFFSATIDKEIKKLAYSLVNSKAIRIQLSPKNPVSKNVTHAITFVEPDHKRFVLERIIKENDTLKFLIFVRTRVRAERVKAAMERVAIQSDTIHGEKEQEDRFAVLKAFKSGENRILIATDVSARGIDVPNVDYVINYDLPDKPENYVHRVGRTGRGNQKGEALSFCAEHEKPLLEGIEEYIHVPIEIIELSKSDIDQSIFFSDDGTDNWKSLIAKNKEDLKKKRKKKK